jgi:hypothetical protein
MTKPHGPPASDVVVEIDAMDVVEWEQGQRTPQASDANLAALVQRAVQLPDTSPVAMPRSVRSTAVVARAPTAVPVPPGVDRPGPARPGPARDGARPLGPGSLARSSSPGPTATSAQSTPTMMGVPLPLPAPAETSRTSRPQWVDERPADHRLDHTEAPPASDPWGADPWAATQAMNRATSRTMDPPDHGAVGRVAPFAPARSPASPASPASPTSPASPASPASSVQRSPHGLADPSDPAPASAARRSWLWWVAGSALASAGAVIALSLLGMGVDAPGSDGGPLAPARETAPAAVALGAAPTEPSSVAPARAGDRPEPPLPGVDRPEAVSGAAGAIAQPGAAAEPPGGPTEPPGATADSDRPSASAGAEPDPGTGSTGRAPARPGSSVGRAHPRPARKRIVVEYADPASEVVAPSLVAQAAEDPAIGRARSAYVRGNQKLFAGDVNGAIEAYQQSLRAYPGYVGGYRGLGLAYAQRGDVDRALEAFRTYLATVPGARDAALIKKRIARLQDK